MDSEKTIEERKKWNAPFLRAFDYLLDMGFAGTKGELCSLIGIQPGLISNYAKGTKKVSLDTMNSIARVSKGILNVRYMLGQSEFMLLDNVPDDEVCSWSNPDKEAMERHKNKTILQPIDQSSLVDAVRAAKDETIADLRERLKEKDERLKEKDERLKEKDERLKEKDERLKEKDERLKEKDELIAALRRQLTNVGHSVMYKTIDDNPIPLAAENV